jgi:hypothetical protein
MKLWATGSQDWEDSLTVARVITLMIQDMDKEDKDITFMHLDRLGAEQIVSSYVSKTKNFLVGKGFKISEFIPSKSIDFDQRLGKVLDQSPDFIVLFNRGKDYKAGKIREFAQINNIKVIEHKSA